MNIAARLGMWNIKGEDMKTITITRRVAGNSSSTNPYFVNELGITEDCVLVRKTQGSVGQFVCLAYFLRAGVFRNGVRDNGVGVLQLVEAPSTLVFNSGDEYYVVPFKDYE